MLQCCHRKKRKKSNVECLITKNIKIISKQLLCLFKIMIIATIVYLTIQLTSTPSQWKDSNTSTLQIIRVIFTIYIFKSIVYFIKLIKCNVDVQLKLTQLCNEHLGTN